MKHLIILIVLLALQVAGGETPRLFKQKKFTAAIFAEAVNHFVALGEEASVKELLSMEVDDSDFHTNHWSVNERIGWMCRVLFEAKTDEALHRPAFGALWNLPPMPAKDWPLFPVALSGSTYFVLSEGYSLAGVPDRPKFYIEYCRKSGVFRTKPVVVPTGKQAVKDAEALHESSQWKAIRWTHWTDGVGENAGQKFGYSLGDGHTQWEYIGAQAEDIP